MLFKQLQTCWHNPWPIILTQTQMHQQPHTLAQCYLCVMCCIHFTGTHSLLQIESSRGNENTLEPWAAALTICISVRCTPDLTGQASQRSISCRCGKQSLVWQTTKVGWSGAVDLACACVVHCDLQYVCLQLSPMCSQSLSLGVQPTFQNTRNSQRGAISASNVSQAKRE